MIVAKLERFEMPRNCEDCDPEFAQQIHCNHWMEGQTFYFERPPKCPLMEINDTDLGALYDAVKRTHDVQTVTIKKGTVEIG